MIPPTIETRIDRRRGCGWRGPGGLYLVADGPARPCGRVPIPLDCCPTCGGGIRPARGWTWVNGTALAASRPCQQHGCSTCPLGGAIGRCGLLWIGECHYPTPAAFLREAAAQGISRRIAALPAGFQLGKTWIMVAHRRAIANADGSFTPAVFQLFRPKAAEYFVREDDPPARLAALAARAITLIRVERAAEPAPLFDADPSDPSDPTDHQPASGHGLPATGGSP